MNDWKTFKWLKVFDFPEIETIEDNGIRHYKVRPDLLLPSMTTMLKVLDDGGIDDWRKRVGEEEAERIVKQAVDRGNNLHDLSERYLCNVLQRRDVKGPATVLFNRTRLLLNELGPLVAIEVPLYSIKDKYAGRVDCIAFHERDLCIVDHKNTRTKVDLKHKFGKKKVFKYMMQLYGYARALNEMIGHMPTHGILIFGNYDTMTATKMKFKLSPLEKEFEIILDAYHNGGDVKRSQFFKF